MPLQYIPKKAIDNMFSSNHRHAMVKKYGYTTAEHTSIEDLEREARINTIIYPNI